MLSDLSEKELNSAVEVYRHAYGDTISEAEAFEEMCCDALGKISRQESNTYRLSARSSSYFCFAKHQIKESRKHLEKHV